MPAMRAATLAACATAATCPEEQGGAIGYNSERTLLEELQLHLHDNTGDSRFDLYGNALAVNITKAPCGLIEHVVVPMTDEHWVDVTGFEAACGSWHDGEDKIQTIQNMLQGSWPESRVLVPWGRGDWKYSDEALNQLVWG
eukprot:gene47970-30409_t